MALATAWTLVVLGAVACLWTRSGIYRCQVQGEAIDAKLIKAGATVGGVVGECTAAVSEACCDPEGPASKHRNLGGSILFGLVTMAAGLGLLAFESERGWGLSHPARGVFYESRVSAHGLVSLALGAPAFATTATCLGGVFATLTALVYQKAAYRREAGDGRRPPRTREPATWSALLAEWRAWAWSASAVWCFAFFAANAAIFVAEAVEWGVAVDVSERRLRNGNGLKLGSCDGCPDDLTTRQYTRWRTKCDLNQALVRNGPLSRWAPLAKACGRTLNFNCALLLVPVTKTCLRVLNGLAGSHSDAQRRSAVFQRAFASPLAAYVPISRNVDFHKLIAATMTVLALIHTLAHLLNYWQSPRFTLIRFAKWGWGGTTFVTGALILVAMFMIITAAFDSVRHAKYEVFFYAHHFFILYYALLLIHGPEFYLWSLAPMAVYAYDRIKGLDRGKKPFVVSRVEWVEPVLAVHFRPLDMADFDFDEGTYVMLNCPFVSEHEWHPFTISSARGDLACGTKVVALDDGAYLEKDLSSAHIDDGVGKKRRATTTSYTRCDGAPGTYDRSDCAHHDFLSCHIKERRRGDQPCQLNFQAVTFEK